MSHQPFETWILSEESLDQEQADSLKEHLAACEPCSNLKSNLQEMQSAMISSSTPEPAPGFTSRWYTRLALDRQKRQQRRMWVLTLGIFALASLILIGLMLFNISSATWPYLFSQLIANISVTFAKVGRFWRVLDSLSNSFPLMIPMLVVIGTVIVSGATILILTWFSSMVRLFTPNRQGVTER